MTTIILTIIGILLAGAAALMVVFYGADAFTGGSVKARAVTVTEALGQVSAAARLYAVQEGAGIPGDQAGMDRLSQRQYLDGFRLPPDASRIIPIDNKGGVVEASAWIIANLGSGEEARSVCAAIERQSGGVFTGEITEWPAKARRQQGCYDNGTPDGHGYLAYRRI